MKNQAFKIIDSIALRNGFIKIICPITKIPYLQCIETLKSTKNNSKIFKGLQGF